MPAASTAIECGGEPEQACPALVPVHDASCCLCEPSWPERVSPMLAGGGALAGLAAVTAVLAALPLKLLSVFGVACVLLIALASLPSRRSGAWTIAPKEIADLELRGLYATLLAAHDRLVDAAVHYGRSEIARAVIDHSRDVLIACGRIARTTNPGARYLAAQSRPLIAYAAEHAPERAERQRQLVLFDELIDQRDRVRAELAVSVARIESATAEIVKQDMLDAGVAARAGGSSDEHGAALQEALEGLISAQAALPPA